MKEYKPKIGDQVRIVRCFVGKSGHIGKIGSIFGFGEYDILVAFKGMGEFDDTCLALEVEPVRRGRPPGSRNKLESVRCKHCNHPHSKRTCPYCTCRYYGKGKNAGSEMEAEKLNRAADGYSNLLDAKQPEIPACPERIKLDFDSRIKYLDKAVFGWNKDQMETLFSKINEIIDFLKAKEDK